MQLRLAAAALVATSALGFAPIHKFVEDPEGPVPVKRVFMVVLENTDADKALAQSFMERLTQEGAYLEKSFGVARPSQPNYLALTSGSTWKVATNSRVNLEATHLGDLLEAAGKSWKAYADGYPGNCFLGAGYGKYARKHLPFLSYVNVQQDPARCARVVNSSQLAKDVEAGVLPEFSLYIPDDDNNGHDTNVTFADRFLEKTFAPLLKNTLFAEGMLFIVTFDESSYTGRQHIYTSFWGSMVKPGARASTPYDYNVLRTIEDALGLGTLGRKDADAVPVRGIWKK